MMIDAIRAAGGHPLTRRFPTSAMTFGKWLTTTITFTNGCAAHRRAFRRAVRLLLPVSARGSAPPASGGRGLLQAVGGRAFRSGRHHSERALYVRLGNDALRALAHSAPRLISPNALTGRINDIYSSTSASGYTFSVQFANISYSAQLDRVWAKAYAKDRLNIQFGLRNVTLVIGNTYRAGLGTHRPRRARFMSSSETTTQSG